MTSQTQQSLIAQIKGMTVLELADLVKALEQEFGVSAAMPAAAAAPADAAAPEAKEEKSEYKVTLQDSGAEKVKVIKALKSVTGLSLSEAKDRVDNAPSVISESAPKADAEKIKKELEAAGAKVQLS